HAGENIALAPRAPHAVAGSGERCAHKYEHASPGVHVMPSPIGTTELTVAAPLAAWSSATAPAVNVAIGAIPILLQPDHPDFCVLLEQRYAGFIDPGADPTCRFDIHLDSTGRASDEDARVFRSGKLWNFQRGDFRAQWDPRAG